MGLFDWSKSPDALYKEALALDRKKDYSGAFALFKKAADKGHIEAAYCTAYDYYKGEGVAQDKFAAIPYYLKAAEGGDKRAFFWAAYAYATGEGVEKDTECAIRWYEKSFEYNEDSAAAYNIAVNLKNLRRYDEALEWAQKAKEMGYETADDLLSRIRREKEETSRPGEAEYQQAMKLDQETRHAEAFVLYKKAADMGHVKAAFCTAYDYFNGKGVAKDAAASTPYYIKAAEGGDKRAYFRVGCAYSNGIGVTRDAAAAIKWHQKTFAHNASSAAAYYIALEYKNLCQYDEALEWAQKAKEQGETLADKLIDQIRRKKEEASRPGEAEYQQALKLDQEKRYAEAFVLYKQAADMGHVKAAYCTAYDYNNGEGVAQDKAAATPYYKLAAEGGVGKAYFRLAYAYAQGIGIDEDLEAANEWYKKEFQRDPDPITVANIALNYRTLQRYDEALEWAQKAKEMGHETADDLIDEIRREKEEASHPGEAEYLQAVQLDSEKRYAEAFALYKQAADKGHVKAAYCTAYDYYNGEGVAQDKAAATPYYKIAAEGGVTNAYFRLGYAYASGTGIGRDPEKANEWYLKAFAHKNDPIIASNIARNFLSLKRYDQALEWAQKAKELDYKTADSLIASIRREKEEASRSAEAAYQHALRAESEKQYYAALVLYKQAAEGGETKACLRLGHAYTTGTGIDKDLETANMWYKKAFESLHDSDAAANIAKNIQALGRYDEALEWAQKAKESGYETADRLINSIRKEKEIMSQPGAAEYREASKQEIEGHYYAAFPLFKKAADQGHIKAAYRTAYDYYHGDGVTKNEAAATPYYKIAAEGGVKDAYFRLGYAYSTGTGITEDLEAAIKWFKKAFQHNPSTASAENIARNAQSLGRFDEALEWAQKAKERGSKGADELISDIRKELRTPGAEEYRQALRLDSEKRYAEAFVLYKKAADMGHVDAAYNAAYDYYHGNGVTKDPAAAIPYYIKAAEGGDARAYFHVGCAYATGLGIDKDLETANKWYLKAFERKNNPATAANIARNTRMLGRFDEALEWAQKAKELGYETADRLIADIRTDMRTPGMVEYRQALQLDHEKRHAEAFVLYKKAADMGHVDAAYNAAYDYYHGDGVTKNEAAATRYYKIAAEGGQAKAYFRLACAYSEGIGVSADQSRAAQWFEKDFEHKPSSNTAYNLAVIYGNRGYYSTALSWAQKAKDLGNTSASDLMERIRRRM